MAKNPDFEKILKPPLRVGFKPISEYGIIGNCRTSALISDDGSLDFACFPNFDSPAVFCSILDNNKGGFFRLAPAGFYQTHQKYLKDTNVLETIFFNQAGSVSLQDLMPISQTAEELYDPMVYGTKIIRLVKAVKGDHKFELKIKITPEFALEKVKIREEEGQIIFESAKNCFKLFKKHHQVSIEKDLVTIKFSLREGEQEFFSLDFFDNQSDFKYISRKAHNDYCTKLYFETIDFWRDWISVCQYTGEYQEHITRSALALKLLTFTPTGAIVAAPTTSLPEKIGGTFNWDYRYTWLRDASFTVYAFLGLGFLKEAERFIHWLENVCLKENSNLKIMYGIHGEEELEERELSHLEGYMHSQPVRVGNEASEQKQFDVFGEVLTALSLYVQAGGKLNDPMKGFVKKLVDYCSVHWQEEDAGIWEPRYGNKHHTYSKLMCWAGVDRGIRIAKKLKIHKADIKSWETTLEQIKRDILEKGYNEKVGAFVIHYGSTALDTSTLNIPIVGLLPVTDKRVLSTIDQVMNTLVVDWFVLRTSDTENKLQTGEGTFFLPTFWLVDCLSLLGRVDEAKVWLNRIIHYATPLGLYAEEFEPYTKNHLGNFPQAFSHLGLINSILNLRQAEVFGKEKNPTIHADRLLKVIKSINPKGKFRFFKKWNLYN